MKKLKYRVYCDYIVKAHNPEQITNFFSNDSDFFENHIIIEELGVANGLIPRLKAENNDEEEIYCDLTEE